MTVGEVLAHIEEDLLASIELLNNSDPYGLAPKQDDYDLPNEDKFFDNREKRFNYWAAVCTLTRVYMWMGRKGEALTLAKSFIDKGGRTSWIDSYTIDAYYEKDRDLTFSLNIILIPMQTSLTGMPICYIIRASGLISYSRLLMV